jgi:hypothetical protein
VTSKGHRQLPYEKKRKKKNKLQFTAASMALGLLWGTKNCRNYWRTSGRIFSMETAAGSLSIHQFRGQFPWQPLAWLC